jgi:ribosomally synthesized peptide (two-chain TOMM family)
MESTIKEWSYTWLKVIAEAWSNPAFRDSLIRSDNEEVRTLFKKHGTVPFPQWLYLTITQPEDAKWVSNMLFWTLPCTELTMRVPKPPGDGNVAAAIANYTRELGRIESDMDQGTESPLPAFEQMMRWFTVWPQAVALAWHNEAFKLHLHRNPRVALYNAFGFQVPGGVELIVDVDADPYAEGSLMPRADLKMVLPPPPPDAGDAGVALGKYSEAGRSYPFTLCPC